MRRQKIKHVSEFQDRHGKWRAKFRKTRFGTYYFKHPVGSEGFWQEYRQCMNGRRPGETDEKSFQPKDRTMNSLVELYYRSPEWKALAESTQKTYRRMLNRFLTGYGNAKVTAFTPQSVYRIMLQWSHAPTEANNLKKRLRTLFHLAIFLGWRDTDPLIGVKNIPHTRKGFHTWTADEIKSFEDYYPSGSKQRLAFTIMLYTGLRRSDLVRIGRQHIQGNRLVIRAIKNSNLINVPVHPALKKELDLLPVDQMQFMLTARGKPFAAAGFGNKMREWCKLAGVPGCSSHGLRKAIACRLYEAGATLEEIGAVLADKNLEVIRVYIEEANIAQLTSAGFSKITKKPLKR